jgi:hypothetical protein
MESGSRTGSVGCDRDGQAALIAVLRFTAYDFSLLTCSICVMSVTVVRICPVSDGAFGRHVRIIHRVYCFIIQGSYPCTLFTIVFPGGYHLHVS